MSYDSTRDLIKSGDILAWSHRSWKTWYDIKVQMVRFFTQSEYCHVGMAYVLGGRVWVLESVIPYVRMVPLSNSIPCYLLPMELKWTPEVEEFALSLVGNAKYSQLEAMKAFFGENHDPKAWECAEYVKAVLSKAGMYLAGRSVPSDVVQAALEAGAKLVYLK